MSYDYSENILVQESAAALLHDELGWDVVLAYNQEVLGENGTLGRKSYREIVLWRYFRQSLRELNPWITDAQITEARQTLSSYLSSASLENQPSSPISPSLKATALVILPTELNKSSVLFTLYSALFSASRCALLSSTSAIFC